MTPPELGPLEPRGTVGRIYKEEHYILLQTKYQSSVSCGFGEDDFLCFPHKRLVLWFWRRFFYVFPMTPPGLGPLEPRGTVGRIYKEEHYILLQAKYESSGSCGFGEEDFFMFYLPPREGHVWTPGARLAGFVKRTTIHCYTQNMKALGLVVSEKKIFICFSHCKSMGAVRCHGNQSSDPTWPKT